jgi:dTMP kinase
VLVISAKLSQPYTSTSSSSSSLPIPSPSSPPTTTTTSKPKLPFEWCRAPDIGLPAPELVLFLDIAPDQARLRGGYVEERYEKEEMQARVRETFKRLGDETETSQASNLAWEGESESAKGAQWIVIDAGKEMDVVSREMWGHVEPLVRNGGLERPVGRLRSDRMV